MPRFIEDYVRIFEGGSLSSTTSGVVVFENKKKNCDNDDNNEVYFLLQNFLNNRLSTKHYLGNYVAKKRQWALQKIGNNISF